MTFEETTLPGVFHVLAAPIEDQRGHFARLYCPEEFAKAGIDFSLTQINLSRNPLKHTLRGMHWQDAPHGEAKFVRCVTGSIFDVVADIRRDSATFGKWIGQTLTAQQENALFVPEGFAHGFITLEEDCDVLYHMGTMYTPGQAKGFRYNDPAFTISWPHAPAMIGEADENWPDFAV